MCIFHNDFYQVFHNHQCINCKVDLHNLFHIHQSKNLMINNPHFHHQGILPLMDITKKLCYFHLNVNNQAQGIVNVHHNHNSKKALLCKFYTNLQHLKCKNFLHKYCKSSNQLNMLLRLLVDIFKKLFIACQFNYSN